MKPFIFGLLMATWSASAQDATNGNYGHPDRSAAILAVEQYISARFIQESESLDGHSMRWVFQGQNVSGLPVEIDVIAYPTAEQTLAAATASYAEARYVAIWLQQTAKAAPVLTPPRGGRQ
jgi:hypothetical protein